MKPVLTRLMDVGSRIFRTDLRYSISGGFYLTLIQVTGAFVSLGLTIAFANLLPVETYGTYRYVLATYSLLAIMALPGIDTAVLQSVSRGFDGTFKRGLLTKLRWGLLGAFASLGYAAYLFATGQYVMASIFLIVGLALPLMESLALYTAVLNGKKKFSAWALIDIITQVVSAISLITTIVLTKNIVAIIFAYFAPYIAVRIVASYIISKRYTTNDSTDPQFAAYGRDVTIFQIIARVIASADQVVLYHFLGPAQVAIFSLATAIPNRVQSVFRITGTLAFPKFASRESADIAASLPRKMLIFGVAILGICVVYVILAPYVFMYVFPKYMPSLEYSQVVMFFTLSAITYPFSSFLFAHKRIAENYFIAIGSFLVKIGCLVGLVPFFGIWGAVIGMLATSATTTTLSLMVLYRERSISSDTPSVDQ